MAYFPEYYGGEYWNRAFTGLGENIAKSLEFYRQRHDQITAMGTEIDALHDRKAPDGRPYIDEKAYQRIKLAHGAEKYGLEMGALQAAKTGMEIDQHQATIQHLQAEAAHARRLAETSPLAGQYIYHPTTQAVIGQYDEKGTPHYFPKQAQPTEEQTEQEQLAQHPSQDPSLVIQKGTPAWHKTVNDIFEGLGLTGKGTAWTGPMKVQPEIRRAIPGWAGGGDQQGGQPQMDIRRDPRVQRIKAALRAKTITKDAAIQQIKALGYTDQSL